MNVWDLAYPYWIKVQSIFLIIPTTCYTELFTQKHRHNNEKHSFKWYCWYNFGFAIVWMSAQSLSSLKFVFNYLILLLCRTRNVRRYEDLQALSNLISFFLYLDIYDHRMITSFEYVTSKTHKKTYCLTGKRTQPSPVSCLYFKLHKFFFSAKERSFSSN